MRIIGKWTIFWWRHNRSRWRHNILIFNGSRDLGLIFQQKTFLGGLDQPAACWISYKTPYFSDFNLWKNPHLKKKITNQTSFSTKSTTLNPMVKSDMVTSWGGTIGFLFFSVAIALIYLGSSGASESTNVEARTNIETLSEWDNDLEDCISWIELSSSNLKE